MKNLKLQNISFFISLIIYNYFFWKENLGINLFIFALLLILNLFIEYRKAFSALNVKITLAGTIITALTVVIYNSTEAKIAHIFSFMLMVAFIHESQLRSVVYASFHILASFVTVPVKIFERKTESLKKFPGLYFVFRIIRLSIFPFMIALIFYMLYCMANPIFSNYSSDIFDGLITAINNFFKEFNVARIFFFVFGALLLSVIYFRNEAKIFLMKDLSFSEKLERIRKNRRRAAFVNPFGIKPGYIYPPPFKSIALKNQNRKGVILLLMVNVLLLFENIIDINWLWFGFELPEGFSLQHYVREGAGFLIASIILSMSLLLYYFEENQNFYPKNKLLKTLAYIWIFQNMVLCFSVFLRNYHYIDFHGLAYKRIGVYVFLSLTIFGLITFFHKIKEIKSTYYLLRLNTWAVYIILVALSCYNWDVKMAKYNLAHWNKGEIDVDFYLKLSDKTLPIVYQNLDSVKVQIEAHKRNKVTWIRYLDYDVFVRDLSKKRERFLSEYKAHSWLSFNVPDEKAYNELSKIQLSER